MEFSLLISLIGVKSRGAGLIGNCSSILIVFGLSRIFDRLKGQMPVFWKLEIIFLGAILFLEAL